MKKKKQNSKTPQDVVLELLKKLKILPNDFLYKVFLWLMKYVKHYHLEDDNTDMYIIYVQKQGGVAGTVVISNVCVKDGMLVVAEGSFPLHTITGIIRYGNTVWVHFKDKNLDKAITATIKDLDKVLLHHGFYSPKENSVINISCIVSIDDGERGNVHLPNDISTDIAREKKKTLRKLDKCYRQYIS